MLRRLVEEWPQIKAPRATEILRDEYGFEGSVDVVKRRLRALRHAARAAAASRVVAADASGAEAASARWRALLLVVGDLGGTWRRSQHTLRIDAWARLSRETRDAIEAEAGALPLTGVNRRIEVVWST